MLVRRVTKPSSLAGSQSVSTVKAVTEHVLKACDRTRVLLRTTPRKLLSLPRANDVNVPHAPDRHRTMHSDIVVKHHEVLPKLWWSPANIVQKELTTSSLERSSKALDQPSPSFSNSLVSSFKYRAERSTCRVGSPNTKPSRHPGQTVKHARETSSFQWDGASNSDTKLLVRPHAVMTMQSQTLGKRALTAERR